MFSSKNSLIASLALCAATAGGTTCQAGGFSFGGGSGNHGNGKSSFNISFGGHGGGHNHVNHGGGHEKHWHDDHHHHDQHVRYYEPVRIVYSQCYHPGFRCCYVFPGDTWYSISKRVYGVDFLCKHIASYNGLSMGSPLVAGQMLRLPVVNANGSLATSTAPMPAPFAPQAVPFAAQNAPIGPQASPIAPQGVTNGLAPQTLPSGVIPGSPQGSQGPSVPPLEATLSMPNATPAAATTPAANIRTVTDESPLPRVAIGSTLALDGESLGDETGIVRLRIGSLTLPVEVIEWSGSSVKIALPKMELGQPVKASLEVLRADGSLASKSEVELTPAATRLALGK